MPLFYQHNINDHTKLGVWRIEEPEDFFMEHVPLQRDITHPHKRLQHLAGRYLLRLLFADFPYHLIEIASTRKPYLPNELYHFSISHCGDYAAAIVSKTSRSGIDIEIPTAKVGRIMHKFLHPSEKEQVNAIQTRSNTDDYLRTLTLLWSAKEAVFKWYGDGEVDFSEHIRIDAPDNILPNGNLEGSFLKNDPIPLQLHYVNFETICLVWVLT
ncbi:MAG: 4'-phosphopantetheinyl transferase family protein [Agriterribacter sp.]